jgi:CBS domain-containing protein
MLGGEKSEMTIEEALRHESLGNLPLSSPASVPPGATLETTLRLMREGVAGCVLVCEGDRLVGIFTERDVLNKLIGSGVSESETVDRFMTSHPASLTPRHTLGDAVRLMTEHGYRHIPLLDEQGRRAGLVAARDIVNYIAEHFPAEVVNLPPRLHQVFKTAEGA